MSDMPCHRCSRDVGGLRGNRRFSCSACWPSCWSVACGTSSRWASAPTYVTLYRDLDLNEAGADRGAPDQGRHPVPARRPAAPSSMVPVADVGARPRRAREGRAARERAAGPRALRQAVLGHDRLHAARDLPAGARGRAGPHDRRHPWRRAGAGAPRAAHPEPAAPSRAAGERLGRADAQASAALLARDGARHHLHRQQQRRAALERERRGHGRRRTRALGARAARLEAPA